jgi:hypothetical protein
MKTTQDQVIELAQKCLSEVPVVVLGSGASRQYGVGGMDELGTCLRKNVVPDDKNGERAIWDKFVADIEANGDLENALHRVTLPPALELRVVEETRKLLLADDQVVFGRIADGSLKLTLAQLLRYLLRTTNPNIVVVTTNYDRLAEFAADQANVPHHTGFSHGYWRTFSDFPAGKPAWVEILKVHGSLDWFLDANQNPVALPDSLPPPSGFTPVMVTPGVGKYEKTHDDPFRTIITRADNAFKAARSILSVGYGFRDRHIQPKLQKRIANDRVPTVFLAKILSGEIRTFLKTCGNPHYLALEQAGTNTRAYFSPTPDGAEVPGSIWEFPAFLEATIGNS